MREFQGKLYYRELIREEASIILKIPSSTAYNFSCTNLTEKQSLSLFRGYRSLVRYWQQLPGAVRGKKLPRLASCTKDHYKCENEWNSAWSVETIKNRDSFPTNLDILASLEKIQTPRPIPLKPGIPFPLTASSNGLIPPSVVFGPPNTHPLMQQCGQKELSDVIQQLKDTLADHFLGSQLP